MRTTPSQRTTVVIPAYNGEKYLAEALGSVTAQTDPASEVIVVDDGSTDATAEIARSFNTVSYVHQQNAGVGAALNHGSRLARGDFIAFLSADDVWKPQKLALQHGALQNAPNRLVFGHMMHFLSPELVPDEASAVVCPEGPMPAFSAGTLLTRMDSFRANGPFNEGFSAGEFIDWYARACDLGFDVLMIDEVVSMRRVHPNNHSTRSLRRKSYTPVLKALLDRRRAGQVAS